MKMNLDNLNAEIARNKLSIPKLAKLINMDKKTLYTRMNGSTSFKQKEILSIANVLSLSPEQILSIFLLSKFPKRNINRTEVRTISIFSKDRKPKEVVPYYQDYPKQQDFYSISLEEYGGALPIHSMRMSFALPYSDWCEFEKSNLYAHIQQYLQELQKRDNLHVTKALED